jgi:hypothetical protein
VQTPDDEKFEIYLKSFDPMVPAPLPALKVGDASRHSLGLGPYLVAFAIVILLAVLTFHIRETRVVQVGVSGQRHKQLEPLTLRSANAWLMTAPSFKAAIDDLAFRPQSHPVPQGKQSAVAVLSEEKIKL